MLEEVTCLGGGSGGEEMSRLWREEKVKKIGNCVYMILMVNVAAAASECGTRGKNR
jgi:hypothetical protein